MLNKIFMHVINFVGECSLLYNASNTSDKKLYLYLDTDTSIYGSLGFVAWIDNDPNDEYQDYATLKLDFQPAFTLDQFIDAYTVLASMIYSSIIEEIKNMNPGLMKNVVFVTDKSKCPLYQLITNETKDSLNEKS